MDSQTTRDSMNWIKCTDQLPTPGTDCLIFPRPDFGLPVHEGLYDYDKQWKCHDNDVVAYKIEVTHWMPIPDDPKD